MPEIYPRNDSNDLLINQPQYDKLNSRSTSANEYRGPYVKNAPGFSPEPRLCISPKISGYLLKNFVPRPPDEILSFHSTKPGPITTPISPPR